MSWTPSETKPPKSKDIEWTTIDVIVSDGLKRGIGHYDYDMGYWNYRFVGETERSDNAITMWDYLPELPKE